MPLSNIHPLTYKFHLVTLHVQQLLIYSFVFSCYVAQRKKMLLEIDNLKSSLENKTSTYITITSILLYYVFNLRDTTE